MFFGAITALPTINHFLPVKLTVATYTVWCAQFIPILNTYKLLDIVDGFYLCPPLYIPDPTDLTKQILNPAADTWRQYD